MKRFMVPFTPREWPLLLHTHKSSLSLMARLDSFSADDDAIVLLLSVCYTRPLLKRLPLLNNCPCLPTSSLLPSRCKRHFSNWRSVQLIYCLVFISVYVAKKSNKNINKKNEKNVIPSAFAQFCVQTENAHNFASYFAFATLWRIQYTLIRVCLWWWKK